MKNIVLLGGNGYIGRNVTKLWMKEDSDTRFYVVSRSGTNQLKDERIINIKDDLSSLEILKKKLPERIDYIVDFVGVASAPKGSTKSFREINREPAMLMKTIALEYQVKAQGYIAGRLGGKEFVQVKKDIAAKLQTSNLPTLIVNPTSVYGNGRQDSFTKMVPLLKFLGLFSKKLKPVDVNEVAAELVTKMRVY